MSIKDDLKRLGHDVVADISNTYQRVHMQHTGWVLPFGQGHEAAPSKEDSEKEQMSGPGLTPTAEPDRGIDLDR